MCPIYLAQAILSRLFLSKKPINPRPYSIARIVEPLSPNIFTSIAWMALFVRSLLQSKTTSLNNELLSV